MHQRLWNEEGKHSVIVGEHIQTCPNVILACPNKCNEKIMRKDIEEHRNECPLEKVDCPFKEAGCEVRLPRKDISEHETTSMQSHLRLNMTATANVNTAMATVTRENNELKTSHDKLKRSNDELKGDLDTILSVVSAELSSIHIPPNDRKPMNGIRTILTSLTTMIQPDGKPHCVHISNKLGIFRESELKDIHGIIQVSSPPLCIYPGFKIYLTFGNGGAVGKWFFLLLDKSDIHGYPKTLSIEVQPTTGQPFSCSLIDFTHWTHIKCDPGREVRIMVGDKLPPIVSDDFYLNIRITDIS